MWIDRSKQKTLERLIQNRPAVLLTGIRQTGKSSLLQRMLPNYRYVTLDRMQVATEARENPSSFLDRYTAPVIFDEIQYAPNVLRELKIRIDSNRQTPGQWVLTGSQRFGLMESVTESLAGRISICNLETLSAEEIRSSSEIDNEHLLDYIWKGGFPETWAMPGLDVSAYFDSYVQTYLERDLRDVIRIADLRDFRRFIQLLASRVGQLLNYANLAKDIGVSPNTVKSWIHALEVTGLVILLPPYYRNLGKRLIKAPKLYFSDHGLVAYLLNCVSMTSWREHIMQGGLWENLVLCELIKSLDLEPGRQLFFFRDQNAVEVDFVIDNGTAVTLVEAKASEDPNPKKLNFSSIADRFGKITVNNVVACTTPAPAQYRDYSLWNPVLSKMP